MTLHHTSHLTTSPSFFGSLQNPAKALAQYSTALGFQATAKNAETVAVGSFATVESDRGIAVGGNTRITGANAIAIGHFSQASGASSIILGASVYANNPNMIILSASGSYFAPETTGFFVQPIRNLGETNILPNLY